MIDNPAKKDGEEDEEDGGGIRPSSGSMSQFYLPLHEGSETQNDIGIRFAFWSMVLLVRCHLTFVLMCCSLSKLFAIRFSSKFDI